MGSHYLSQRRQKLWGSFCRGPIGTCSRVLVPYNLFKCVFMLLTTNVKNIYKNEHFNAGAWRNFLVVAVPCWSSCLRFSGVRLSTGGVAHIIPWPCGSNLCKKKNIFRIHLFIYCWNVLHWRIDPVSEIQIRSYFLLSSFCKCLYIFCIKENDDESARLWLFFSVSAPHLVYLLTAERVKN